MCDYRLEVKRLVGNQPGLAEEKFGVKDAKFGVLRGNKLLAVVAGGRVYPTEKEFLTNEDVSEIESLINKFALNMNEGNRDILKVSER